MISHYCFFLKRWNIHWGCYGLQMLSVTRRRSRTFWMPNFVNTRCCQILVVLSFLCNLVVVNYIETSALWGESSLLVQGNQVILSRFSLHFQILLPRSNHLCTVIFSASRAQWVIWWQQVKDRGKGVEIFRLSNGTSQVPAWWFVLNNNSCNTVWIMSVRVDNVLPLEDNIHGKMMSYQTRNKEKTLKSCAKGMRVRENWKSLEVGIWVD